MESNIRKGLLQFVFSGAYMKRWNDKLRPMELIEIDKQAHKMIVAWMLCQIHGKNMTPADKLALEESVVEGGIFDYLFRLIITDIKPPILYRIKENHAHFQELAKWAIAEIEPHLRPLNEEFWNRFKRYVLQEQSSGKAADILAAAHLFSSVWEFRLLQSMNGAFDDELPEIDRRFTEQLEEFRHVQGMSVLMDGLALAARHRCSNTSDTAQNIDPLARVANLCGQLRFQKRWSQTPRIPETSVMGHMFIVACYSFFVSMALGACPARRVNNFFCGLFHDLPELLTRDIISPVKKSFEDLGKIIREYENQELERRFFTPLNNGGYQCITERLGYYLGLATDSEFDETIIDAKGRVKKVDFNALQLTYNKDHFDPKDGTAVKTCDVLAAYIEAYTAIRNGITADHIQQAFWRMREQYSKCTLGTLHVGALFTDFD